MFVWFPPMSIFTDADTQCLETEPRKINGCRLLQSRLKDWRGMMMGLPWLIKLFDALEWMKEESIGRLHRKGIRGFGRTWLDIDQRGLDV